MKRKELIKKLNDSGCILVRHGSRHDLYKNPATGKKQPVQDIMKLTEIVHGIL